MDNNICIPKDLFFIIIVIILLISVFYKFFEKYFYNIFNNKHLKKTIKLKNENNKIIVKKDISINNNNLINRDRRVINDPIIPPERRVPRHIYPSVNIKNITNIPTRGKPDNYQLMGIISRDSDEKVMQLFGRQLYPGSSQYEYYIRGKDLSGLEIKFPLSVENDKELYNNDTVSISQMNNEKGDFVVTLYELDTPKYNPYI